VNTYTIILISGYMGSGKTTAAKWLRDKFGTPPTYILSLSSPIKEIAKVCFGWDGVKDNRGRKLLQVLGTEAGREYNPNIWVERLYKTILSHPQNSVILVDDWRFFNEYSYFCDKGVNVVKIRINNPRVDRQASHVSETTLVEITEEKLSGDKHSFYDFAIINDGGLDEFYSKLYKIYNQLKETI
jgi:hypothetical protein